MPQFQRHKQSQVIMGTVKPFSFPKINLKADNPETVYLVNVGIASRPDQ